MMSSIFDKDVPGSFCCWQHNRITSRCCDKHSFPWYHPKYISLETYIRV